MQKKVNKFNKINMNSDKKNTHAEIFEIENIRIAELNYNPHQPRKIKDDEFIKKLAKDINKNGLLQPIIYTEKNNKLYIVAGHTRFEAYKLLEKETIEAINKDEVTDKNLFLFSLAENETRKQLLNIEIGLSFKKAIDDKLFKNQKELANNVNLTERIVGSYLSLTKLDNEIIKIILNEKLKLDTEALLLLRKFDNPIEIFKELKDKNFTRKTILERLKELENKIENTTEKKDNKDIDENEKKEKKKDTNNNKEDKYIYKSNILNGLDIEYLSNKLKDKYNIKIDIKNSKGKKYIFTIEEI